jgi:PAS domain S-box-containing protein
MIDRSLLKGSVPAELLEQILRASPEYSIVGVDLDGDIVLWNEGAHRLYGWPPDEIIGRARSAALLHVPENVATSLPERMLATAREEGRWDGVVNSVRMDGSTFVSHTSVTPRLSAKGGLLGFLLVSSDVSDELRLTHHRRATQSFTRMFDSNMSPLLITDPSGAIIDLNSQVEPLMGTSREGLIGSAFKDHFTNPDGALAMTEVALHDGKDSDHELTVRRGDGTEVEVLCNAAAVFDPTGKLYGVFIALKDITERKRHHQEVERHRRELELKNVELERADRGKDRFLASMSHELRNPLNIMLGFTGALLMGMAGEPNEELRHHLQTVESAGKHQLAIINDLLDVARIEDGKWVGDFQPVGCRTVAREVIAFLDVRATVKGLRLSVVAPAREINVVTDRRTVTQILINLASNAINFTEQGEVRVEIQRRHPDGVPAIAFDVVDSGAGIELDDQAKLFDAFEQAQRSTAAHEGTGLGLYISQRLARVLGGEISFRSRLGEGSTFTLTLPRDRSHPICGGHTGAGG